MLLQKFKKKEFEFFTIGFNFSEIKKDDFWIRKKILISFDDVFLNIEASTLNRFYLTVVEFNFRAKFYIGCPSILVSL